MDVPPKSIELPSWYWIYVNYLTLTKTTYLDISLICSVRGKYLSLVLAGEGYIMIDDYIYTDNLSHILNKKIGLNDDASQEERDEVFEDGFGASSEWTMVTNLVWEWLEENEW